MAHSFSIPELHYYSRQFILPNFGIDNQEKLKAAKVLVIGAGGLGCPTLLYLASAGIGTLGILDFDTIEAHNIHRQILYNPADIGKKKAETAYERIAAHNPHIKLVLHNLMINESNAIDLISNYNIVIDGSDNFLTRYLVNDTCVQLNKPLVYGTIFGFDGQLAAFNVNGSKNLRHLYPEAPPAEDVPNCDENGVIGFVPGLLAMMMVSAGIQIILGQFKELNTLKLIDTLSLNIKNLKF